MSGMVGLDFETYGAMDLPRYGLHRYVNNKTFTPLLAAVAWFDESGYGSGLLDFTGDYERYEAERELMLDLLGDRLIVAHNASFEQSVLGSMGIRLPSRRFIDSAVLARAAGAAGKLEAAAPQLLGIDKLEIGLELIKVFSIPGSYQEENGSLVFDPRITQDHADQWAKFGEYCRVDAELSLKLAVRLLPYIGVNELTNSAVTMDMNNTGWRVDLDVVEEMQRRYLRNIEEAVEKFRFDTGAYELNLNSSKQLMRWCAARGVRSSSFDEAHVERLLARLDQRVTNPSLKPARLDEYNEVRHLLRTKQELGGSSLKKLQVILDITGEDGRLHDQYLHIGAGATYRTTGRGVQMQNLKRLNGGGSDMSGLFDLTTEWSNGQLASNLRQVFTASDPTGQLVVGDFSSVESRGLAWQAGERWKLDAYRSGQDLYKVQAAKIFGKVIDQVTKDDRQIGKVGELSCGYGAGPVAVKEFAEKMGVVLSEAESMKLVKDWRDANPRTVQYWYALNDALHAAVGGVQSGVALPHGRVEICYELAPQSLRDQVRNPNLVSLYVQVWLDDGQFVLSRVIHGAHVVGRNIQYWKPSERKTGDLWVDQFTNPKTKRMQKFTVYGGKLAGLITQSLCRELFFDSLRQVHTWAKAHDNVALVGQFHDEIVLDWTPGVLGLAETRQALTEAMTCSSLPAFPLAAEVKSDYRYTK